MEEGQIPAFPGFSHVRTRPPVRAAESAAAVLTEAFGPDAWSNSVGFFSPAWHWCSITLMLPDALHALSVVRTGWACHPANGPERAFLKAYQLLGGQVDLPKEEQPDPPAPLPKRGPQTAPPIAASLPSDYTGPVPYNDSHTNIPPVRFSKPPQKPDWFGARIGGFGTKRENCHWTKEWTWDQVVKEELDNPKGRDNALGLIQWKIGKDPLKFDGPDAASKRGHYVTFIGRAKAAAIWAMLALEVKREEADAYDPPADDYGPDVESPF